jgi:hypothetical protein
MLILFDHVTPAGIARFLAARTVTKAKDRGWDTLTHGVCLAEAERFFDPSNLALDSELTWLVAARYRSRNHKRSTSSTDDSVLASSGRSVSQNDGRECCGEL